MKEHTTREEDRAHRFEVQIAVLAEGVDIAPSGNVTIRGVFNAIYATSFPTQLADLTVLVRVHYGLSAASTSPKPTIFKFANEDGSLHEFRLDAWFPPPAYGVWAISDNSITLKNFPIEASGEYCFEFWVDGHRLCTLPLMVSHVNPDQQANPGTTPAAAQKLN